MALYSTTKGIAFHHNREQGSINDKKHIKIDINYCPLCLFYVCAHVCACADLFYVCAHVCACVCACTYVVATVMDQKCIDCE